MTKRHLIIPDPHAIYNQDNDRATAIGNFINCTKPDVVINMGDGADMPSLCSYDKGLKGFHGRTYKADIDAFHDFEEKLWHPVKKTKKKLPRRVYLVGNHDQRIVKAIQVQPELEGTISLEDLRLNDFYTDVVHYNGGTPGVIELDGVLYAHYFTTGVLGKPCSGEHPAYTLLTKRFMSCTQGHTHTFDYCIKTRADGKRIMGLVTGCGVDYNTDWAGEAQKYWYPCVILKDEVEDGCYQLSVFSIDKIKRMFL